MVQSPSWAADWLAATQEIPRISRNPKVHHRTHKRPPPVPILGQPDPVHMSTSHLLQIHSNIIHPPTPRSPQWSLSLRFPHQDPIHLHGQKMKCINKCLHVVGNNNTLYQSQSSPKRQKRTGGVEVYLCSYFNLGARWEWVANATIRLLHILQKARESVLQKAGRSSTLVWKVTENSADTGARKPEPISLQQASKPTEQSRLPQ